MDSKNGAIYVTESQTGISLSDIYATAALSGTKLALLSNNSFLNLKSFGDQGGAAINFDCNLDK